MATASMKKERTEGIMAKGKGVRVIVNKSVEPLDFDAWAELYIARLIEADERTHRMSDAA